MNIRTNFQSLKLVLQNLATFRRGGIAWSIDSFHSNYFYPEQVKRFEVDQYWLNTSHTN